MPSSRASTIPYVICAIKQLHPKSILDVGIGFGKWGYLFREYTDVIKSESDPGRYAKTGWKVRIEGIEAYTGYLHEAHNFIYDKIHIGDAQDIIPNLGMYDVIFFGDIIEHFPLNEGKKLLKTAIKQCNKCVILTTPKYDTDQTDSCNNPLERHRSVWGPKDFRDIGSCLITLSDKATYVVAYPEPSTNPLELRIEHGRTKPSWIKKFFKDKLRPIIRYLSKIKI